MSFETLQKGNRFKAGYNGFTEYLRTNKEEIKCREEIEQALEVKALEQVEAWDEVADLAVLPQALEESAFALTVVNGFPTGLESLALSKNAPSVGPP